MKKLHGLVLALVFAAFAGQAIACEYCTPRRGWTPVGYKCALVWEDGETGFTICDDDEDFGSCDLSGSGCMFVVVVGGGGGGGGGTGGGGGGGCVVYGANWCPATCWSCTYQLF